jgi:hypothetical protein
MKKLIYSGLFLALVGIWGVACKKQEFRNGETKSNLQMALKSSLAQGITVKNGMLHFQDMDHVRNTLDNIYNAYLTHENKFLNSNPGKTGEELMDIEEATNFNDYLPYEHFESTLNFNSLRKKIQSDFVEYQNSGLDNDSDPENHFIIEEPVQTILNEFEEVTIGGSIYKFYENGYIRIIDGSYSTLLAIRSNKNSIEKFKNVEIEGDIDFFMNKSSSGCNGHRALSDKYTSGGRRIKWRVAIQTLPWSRYVIAQSRNYVKKNGRWKKFRCHTKCRVWGDISDYTTLEDGNKVADCDKALTFNVQNGVYSDKYNTKSWQHKVFVSTRTKSGWIKGYHYSYINFATEYNSSLTFN